MREYFAHSSAEKFCREEVTEGSTKVPPVEDHAELMKSPFTSTIHTLCSPPQSLSTTANGPENSEEQYRSDLFLLPITTLI